MEGLLIKILGASVKGAVTGLLRNIGLGISPDIIAAVIGWFLATKQSGWLKDFGEGLLIGAASQIVSPLVQQLTGSIGGGATQTQTYQITPEAVAYQYAMTG